MMCPSRRICAATTEARHAAIAGSPRVPALFDDAAGDPRTATAEGLRMVGMIVSALVNHQRQAFDIAQALQARRQHWLTGFALAVDVQRRQVAHMAVTPGFAMLAAVLRVPVTARCARRGLQIGRASCRERVCQYV